MTKKNPSKTSKPAAKKAAVKKKTTPEKKTEVKATPKPATKVIKSPVKAKSLKRPVKTTNDGLEIALTLAQGMVEKKAEEIKILDMRGVAGASADFFVISHALSGKQVEAIADSAEEALFKKTKERPWHREGFENLEWVLLDYINVVVHVFEKEKRGFYSIEELWGDAKPVTFKSA